MALTNTEIIGLADSATPSVATSNSFYTQGYPTYTNFIGGVTGQIIYILASGTCTVVDGTNIFLSGSANWTMADGDTLTLIQKADGKWYELARGDN